MELVGVLFDGTVRMREMDRKVCGVHKVRMAL